MVAVRKFYFHSKAHVPQKSDTNCKNFRCAALLRSFEKPLSAKKKIKIIKIFAAILLSL